jgi:hypothetical protein
MIISDFAVCIILLSVRKEADEIECNEENELMYTNNLFPDNF